GVEIDGHEKMVSAGARGDSLGNAYLPETKQGTGPRLGDQRQVCRDDGGDLRVATGDRAIGAEDDRLAIGGEPGVPRRGAPPAAVPSGGMSAGADNSMVGPSRRTPRRSL